MVKTEWLQKYISRVTVELYYAKVNEKGKLPITVYTHDLLAESGLAKGVFYEKILMMNSVIDDRIVLCLKGVHEKI